MENRDSQIPRIAVTPDDAAIATGRTRTRIFKAIRDGELEARRDGKAVVIELSELMRWVKTFPVRQPNPRPKQKPALQEEIAV